MHAIFYPCLWPSSSASMRLCMGSRRGFICRMKIGQMPVDPMSASHTVRIRQRNTLGPSNDGQQYAVVHVTGYIKNWPPSGRKYSGEYRIILSTSLFLPLQCHYRMRLMLKTWKVFLEIDYFSFFFLSLLYFDISKESGEVPASEKIYLTVDYFKLYISKKYQNR